MSDPLEQLRTPVIPIAPRRAFADGLLARLRGAPAPARDSATVRYFVDDLELAVTFYREVLGFEEELRPSPRFAMLYRGDLRLLLSVPGEPHLLPDGTLPRPGGDNRISLRVEDLPEAVARLRDEGARLRGAIAPGFGVDTVLLEDPAGNPIELFAPRAGYHERGPMTPTTPTGEEHTE